jgi:hypothetical protein
MGKHSNLILVGPDGRVVAAAKHVGKLKSSRPIMPGVRYELPPTHSASTDPPEFSPFYRKLVAANPGAADEAAEGLKTGHFHAVLSPGAGAYPLSVASLGLKEFPRESISIALEQHYAQAIPDAEADALRNSLLSQLDRVILARDVALRDLQEAEDAGVLAAARGTDPGLWIGLGGGIHRAERVQLRRCRGRDQTQSRTELAGELE